MKILNSLVDQDLIVRNEKNGHTVYKIAEKGKNVLEYFSLAMEAIEIR